MLEDIRKGLVTGLGAVVLTREKIEAVCRKLVEDAKMSREDAQKLADDLYHAGERQWGELEKNIKDTMRSALSTLDIGSENDLKLLRSKVDNIEKRVTLLEAVGHVPKEKGTPSH
ncbi:MAG: phasin family protein [Desulfobacterales bacterium]